MKIQKYHHHILEGIKENGHVGINPRYQVRHLIQGINIPELDSVKAQIMMTVLLSTDYYGCVSMYRKFINQSNKVYPPELSISAVESSNHKGGGYKKRKGDSGGAVKDAYYSKEEYKALSSDQRSELYNKWQARGHKPEEKKVKFKEGGATDDLVKQVSAMVAVMTSVPESPGTDPPTTNSKNPALTRQIILRG